MPVSNYGLSMKPSQRPADTDLTTGRQTTLPALDAELAARRLQAAEALYRSAWELRLAWLRRCHPDLPETELRRKVREIFLHASG